MNSLIQMRKQAHKLRKDGQFAEALKIYKQIWDNGKDAYVAAGLLQCLRKLKNTNRHYSLFLN